MKKNLVLQYCQWQGIILLLFIVFPLNGQEYNEKIPALETWAQMAPEAGMVSLYSGTVGAKIPLCHYKDPDFDIPVDIIYSYGGFRPGDSGEGLGLGWGLRVGGVITREVRGIPDDKDMELCYPNGPVQHFYGFYYEHSFPYYRYENQMYGVEPTLENCNYLWTVFNDNENRPTWNPKMVEFARDIFHFRFGEYSGSFVLDYNGQVKVFNSNYPHGEFKFDLSHLIPANARYRSEITMIMGNGVRYTFEARYSYDTYNQGYDPDAGDSKDFEYNLIWTLKEIKSHNDRVVSFQYMDPTIDLYKKIRFCKDLEVQNMDYSFGDDYYTQYPCRMENLTNDIYVRPIPRIRSVNICGKGYLTFIYNGDQISRIENCLTGQKYQLRYSNLGGYFLLNEVEFSSGEKYFMEYYNDNVDLGSLDVERVDHWGYFNDRESPATLPSLMSGQDNLEFTLVQGNNPVFEKSRYYMLKKLTNPLKGYTTFKYEPHKYTKLMRQNANTGYKPMLTSVPAKEAGGVRVKRIANYSSPVDSTWVEYEYGNSTNQGNLLYIPWYKRVSEVRMQCPHEEVVNAPTYTLMETVNFNFQPSYSGPHVEYPIVTEKRSDGSSIKYFYSSAEEYPDIVDYSFNEYDDFTHYSMGFMTLHGNLNETLDDGKHDTDHSDIGWWPIGNERLIWIEPLSRSSLRGKPIRMEMINASGNKVKEEVLNYNYRLEYVEGVDRDLWRFAPYKVLMASEISVERTVTQYFFPGQLSTTDSMIYNRYGELVRHAQTRSDGSVIAENHLFVKDLLASDRLGVHDDMLSLNVVNIPLKSCVELYTPQNSTRLLLHGTKNEFMILYHGFYDRTKINVVVSGQKSTKLQQPVVFNRFDFDTNLLLDAECTYDDQGRVQSVTLAGGEVTTYVWGYNCTRIVAEIKNATPEEVEAALHGVSLSNIRDRDTLSSTHKEALSGLRTALLDARVTINVYGTHGKLLSTTDPSGKILYMEYDGCNRLIRKKDTDGNILEEYEYGINLE